MNEQIRKIQDKYREKIQKCESSIQQKLQRKNQLLSEANNQRNAARSKELPLSSESGGEPKPTSNLKCQNLSQLGGSSQPPTKPSGADLDQQMNEIYLQKLAKCPFSFQIDENLMTQINTVTNNLIEQTNGGESCLKSNAPKAKLPFEFAPIQSSANQPQLKLPFEFSPQMQATDKKPTQQQKAAEAGTGEFNGSKY